jgi:hypothetical protein
MPSNFKGGGHSTLSNTMGLGVDRVVRTYISILCIVTSCDVIQLQFKVVTPDGQYRTVNKCQNSDLFFALRGGTYFPDLYLQKHNSSLETGGGGTFGVVLESTILASPQVTIQAVLVTFSPNATLTKQLWTILVDNGVQWANDTWGGLANSNTAVYISPKLSKDDAAKSMAPLIQFGQQLVDDKVAGANVVVTTFPSYGTFFNFLVSSEVAVRLSDRFF